MLAVHPGHADAYSNLGVALKNQGKLDEAIAAYCKAICIKPDHVEAHSNLGNVLRDQGKFDEAVAAYREAIRISPDQARAYSDLGVALADQGNFDEAAAIYRKAISIKPDYAEAHFNLGNVLKDQGKLDEAVAAYRQAISIRPNLAVAQSNLGNTLLNQGNLDEAVAAYRRAIEIMPTNAEVHYNLGNGLKDQGELDGAVASYRRSIILKPDHAGAHCNLAIALMDQGKLDEAVAAYRQALVLKPDYADSHSNLLFCLNYVDDISNEEIYKESVCWNERHALRYRPSNVAYNNERRSDRRLRIGYVSPDLRTHSVAYFLEPLLQGHDRQAVEIFCYADVVQPDSVTTRLQGLADHWLMTIGLSDDKLAARIRTDGIDILIDLAGHTAHNRLGVFAREPAPVQVTWLGYPNTTGLDAIDYRLVDAVTDPVGEADACASETLLRLPSGFLCYGGPEGMPEPADPPCLTAATVTFGSFNNPAKVSPSTLDVWAKLLTRLPEARLLLKGKSFANATTRALFIARLGERGVAPERVELVAWAPSNIAHLALYERVDIALDPFPYNGTTTTCEALWMGVPVITLRGDRHAGRVGASLLSHGGLTDWIAGSVEDYVEIAVALAGNPSHLRDLRRSLRPHLKASPLCDSKAFAGQIEAAFRTMWQQWQLNL
jgi:protein O-GlcNAc transferase